MNEAGIMICFLTVESFLGKWSHLQEMCRPPPAVDDSRHRLPEWFCDRTLALVFEDLLEICQRTGIVSLAKPEDGIFPDHRIGIRLRHVQQFRDRLVLG